MTEAGKDGRVLLIVAIVSIPVWLLLSNGYAPSQGALSSFYYSMYVLRAAWFCDDVTSHDNYYDRDYVTSLDCWNIELYTKYMVLASLLLATYGYLIMSELLRNPFAWLRSKWRSRASLSSDEGV